MSGAAPTGLDYTAVHAVMQIRGAWEPEVMFDQIRTLERGYLWAVADRDLDELLTYG
jgi:hypothetical protein